VLFGLLLAKLLKETAAEVHRSERRHSADVPFIPLPPPGTAFEGFHPNDDVRALHAKGSSQFGNGSERRTLDAAFDQADVGAIQAAVQGKAFLRDPGRSSADLASSHLSRAVDWHFGQWRFLQELYAMA
jgi:hypothetical protein